MVACPFIYILVNKMDKRSIIVIGLLIGVISIAMIGSYDFFDNDESMGRYYIVLSGTGLVCIGSSMVNIPTMPEMILQYESDQQLRSIYN